MSCRNGSRGQSGEAPPDEQPINHPGSGEGVPLPGVVVGPVTAASLAGLYEDIRKLFAELSSLLQTQVHNITTGQQLSVGCHLRSQ